MLASQVPLKFPIPFANAAGSGFTRQVPQASQIGILFGAASLTDGFPPACFQPVGAGGVPPAGQDWNGLFNQITKWNQWQAAGAPEFYDSTFSSAIGGYPAGAVLSSTSVVGNFWLSTVDNNTSNPDAGGANWTSFSAAIPQSLVHFGIDSGSTNAYTLTSVNPPISAYVDGMVIIMRVGATNTGASTVKEGTLARIAITRADGSPTQQGDLQAGQDVPMIYHAPTTSFLISGLTSVATPARNLQSYSTAGTYTWTAPQTGWYFIRLCGAGGGGAGGGGGSTTWSSGGGGSGGYSEGWNFIVVGTNVTVTIGAGGPGAGNSNGATATTGGTTSFGSYLQATGGGGAIGGTASSSGGVAGVGSGGQTNLPGANGGDGNNISNSSQGGAGASSAFGGGGRTATLGHGTSTAADGIAPGSGGGGIWQDAVAAQTGGYGAAGIVIIQY